MHQRSEPARVPLSWVAVNALIGFAAMYLSSWYVKATKPDTSAMTFSEFLDHAMPTMGSQIVDAWPGFVAGLVYCIVAKFVIDWLMSGKTPEQKFAAWFVCLVSMLMGLLVGYFGFKG